MKMRFPGTKGLVTIFITACMVGRVYAQSCPVPQPLSDSERWSGQAIWQTLASEGYRIGKITIEVDDVFAPDESDYGRWYAKTANAIHIKTRISAIRSLLLFKPGDPVEARVIYQALRRLRAQTYLHAASITPTDCYGGKLVVVTVRTHDAWTLKVGARYSHVGGSNIYNIHFEESNFLGFGKELLISQTGDPQRYGSLLHYRDPAIAGSRWQMLAEYQYLSDGYGKALDVSHPFQLDTDSWATYLHYSDRKTNLNFYNHTNLAWLASDHIREYEWKSTRLLSFSAYTGYRMGLSFEYSGYEYGLLQSEASGLMLAPELTPRTFSGLALTWQMFQDHYANYRNMANIGRAEDYNLGWNIGASLGYYATAFGSTQPAWFGGLDVSYGKELPHSTLMQFSASASGRNESGEVYNMLANVSATFYNQAFPYQTLVAHVQIDERFRPDPENFLYLGGLDGLRGYPNYLLIGDRRWTVVLADRVLTPWKIGSFFQLGLVGYLEAGQIHQLSPSAWSRGYADAGVGLRFGNLKSAEGQVISLTVAKPLVKGPHVSSYEIVVGGTVTF